MSEMVVKKKRSEFDVASIAKNPHTLNKALWILALPALGEMLLNTAVGMIDTAMVGRIGKEAVAAVGLANRLVLIVLGVFTAITMGTTAMIARYIGAGEPQRSSKVLNQSISVALFFAIILGVPSFVLAKPLMKMILISNDVVVLEWATQYYQVMASSFLVLFFGLTASGALRGAGDMSGPMWVVLGSNLINVLFNYLLINGVGPFPKWGVFGAGIATLISRIVAAIVFFFMLLKDRKGFRLDLKSSFKPTKDILAPVFKIGFPAAVEQIIMRVGQFAYYFIIIGLGTASQAAHEVALNAESISYNLGYGFALAATTMVAQFLGANQPDLAQKAGMRAAKLGSLVMGAIGVLFLLIPEVFARIFVPNDLEVIALASTCLRITALSEPFFAFVIIQAGALRGAGDTVQVMLYTFVGIWIVRVSLAYLLAVIFNLGLAGAWWAMATDIIIRSLLISRRFKTGKWRYANI